GVSLRAAISRPATWTSISPVAISGFTFDAGRAATSPSTRITSSARSFAARARTSGPLHSGPNESWTRPDRSRSSTKISPPRSRRRCTQPASRTVLPASSRRSVPTMVVRSVVGNSRLIFPLSPYLPPQPHDEVERDQEPQRIRDPIAELRGSSGARPLPDLVDGPDEEERDEAPGPARPPPRTLPAVCREGAEHPVDGEVGELVDRDRQVEPRPTDVALPAQEQHERRPDQGGQKAPEPPHQRPSAPSSAWRNSPAERAARSRSRTSSRRTSREIRLKALMCGPAAVSGPTSRKKRRTGCPSSASKSTGSAVTPAAILSSCNAGDLPCGIATPYPIPVE